MSIRASVPQRSNCAAWARISFAALRMRLPLPDLRRADRPQVTGLSAGGLYLPAPCAAINCTDQAGPASGPFAAPDTAPAVLSCRLWRQFRHLDLNLAVACQ